MQSNVVMVFLRFEWYMTRIVVKNVHCEVMCYDVFNMHVHNIDATLGSIVNAMERPT